MSNDFFAPKDFVTGTVIALKGKINTNGFFEVSDYTFPGIPSINQVPTEFKSLMRMDTDEEELLMHNLGSRNFAAFISGVEFGTNFEKTSAKLFLNWMLGNLGTKNDKLLTSRISHLVIGGNTIGDEQEIDEVIKGSFRTHEINERVYSNLTDALDNFESFLHSLSEK